MKQNDLQKFLATRGIPHFSLEVFGTRIKVVTLKEEYAVRWVVLLGKIAECDPITPCTAQEKKHKGQHYQPPAVPAYKITATIRKGASHEAA